MVALANRPTLPVPETAVPRPAGRVKDESPGPQPAPTPDAGERPTFLRALLRALGVLHT
jgi:hypothetical protein